MDEKSFLEMIDDLSDDMSTAAVKPRRRAVAMPACDSGDMSGRFTDAATALRFMRAGNATITLRSKATQTRFTYRLRESDDKQCLFVGLLNGSDNESNYKYLGRISREVFWAGRKVPRDGDIGKDAPSSRAFAWSWQKLVSGTLPEQLEVWHEGSCGRCGRKLTVPESIASGFGPECRGKI